jgi:hypothetical protein
MAEQKSRRIALSLPRSWVGDLLYFAKDVPVVAGERTIRIKAIAQARAAIPKPPSWLALLVKGLGIVSQRMPELRRSYMPYPWPHLYESGHSVAAITMHRVYEGENATFLAGMPRPEEATIDKIQTRLHKFQNAPIEEVSSFRRMIGLTKLPFPLRRIAWWFGLNALGKYRVQFYGTFSINSVAALRSRMLQFITLTPSLFYYDKPTDGELNLQIAFDHRVYDGVTAARAMNELESVLNTEILAELQPPQTGLRLAA